MKIISLNETDEQSRYGKQNLEQNAKDGLKHENDLK